MTVEELDVGPVKYKRRLHWEFFYKGDGKKWTLDETYLTTTGIEILQDPQKVGSSLKQTIGRRDKIN